MTDARKQVSCWKKRTKLERNLICTIITALLIIIALAVVIQVSRTSSKTEQYCVTDICIKEAANLLNRMDPSTKPCDDFYQFVCGRYINETEIPEDKTELDSLSLISDLINVQVRTVVSEPSTSNEIKPFSMMKKLFRKCMNVSAIQETSLEEMEMILGSLGGWPVLEQDKWVEIDWVELTGRLRKHGYSTDHFITIDVDSNPRNSTERVISIDEGRNQEINENNLKNGLDDDLVQNYADYLIDMAVLFGADRDFAVTEVNELIEFRANLAKFIVSKSVHYKLLINSNITTISEMQRNYPTIDWVNLINNAIAIPNKNLTGIDKVALAVPNYIKQFEQLIQSTSKRVQVNHALFEIVRSSIEFLPRELRRREQEFMALATGATLSRPRWRTCIDKATHYFNLAADALYIRKFGNEDAKKDVTEMISYIRKVFVNVLKNVEWMDSDTKQRAIEKAEAITAHVAYSAELNDDQKIIDYYKGLRFEAENILHLIREVSKFKRDKLVSNYGKPVEKNHWSTRAAAITSNAFYDPQENSIQIPAGIMQREFYTQGKPSYMNYGGLGLVIGHEITHGFDSDGKWFNKMGDVMNWWKKSTHEAFTSKAECFIEQYGNYTVPEVELNIDGVNTLAENIADNGGAKEAYLAYLEWIKQNKPEPLLPGIDYSPKQLFWISLTNAWCTKNRQSSMEQIVLGDEHSPDRYRILGALSNSPQFAEDFNCPLGSKMNPAQKCQIW